MGTSVTLFFSLLDTYVGRLALEVKGILSFLGVGYSVRKSPEHSEP